MKQWREYWEKHGKFEPYLDLMNKDKTRKDKNFCRATKPKSTEGGSPPLSSKLTCNGIITETKKAGDYTFQMQVFRIPTDPKIPEKDPIATRTTDTIAVKPDDEPQILSFAPTRAIYQELSTSTIRTTLIPTPIPTLTSTPALTPTPTPTPTLSPTLIQTRTPSPTLIQTPSSAKPAPTPTTPAQPVNAPGLVQLNWKISNWSRIEEIRIVALSLDGAIQGEPKSYSIEDLKALCPSPPSTESELDCKNLPTTIRKPGDYVFRLTAIVKQEQGKTELTRSTEPVKIQPRPLEIKKFTVNGKPAVDKPEHIYLQSSEPLNVEWEVIGGEDIKVELLPAPGAVDRTGNIAFSITTPGSETITLKVSNKFGEQKMQSVTVQTIAPQDIAPDPIVPPPPSGKTNPNNSGNPAPPTSPPDELEPIEVPPRPN